jgi:hypothetical protein
MLSHFIVLFYFVIYEFVTAVIMDSGCHRRVEPSRADRKDERKREREGDDDDYIYDNNNDTNL